MTSEEEFLQAIKLFCKEVQYPKTCIVDPSGSQTKNEVRACCHKVSTTLRLLEESISHTNTADLYIGFIKQGFSKDTEGTY